MRRYLVPGIAAALLLAGCKKAPVISNHAPIDHVRAQLEKYAPVEIGADDSHLSDGDRQALVKLVQASQVMDEIFLRQVYHRNVAIREALHDMTPPGGEVLRDYFRINFGPFDRRDGDRPFIDTTRSKPPGANYYPPDMTVDEFEAWVAAHPEQEEAFRGYFHVIRRDGDGLSAVPYSKAYEWQLVEAAQLLEDAANLTTNESLKTYLDLRAKAFLTNDYFESDMAWMDLTDHDIEVVIGPYEVYEDRLFNYKAAYESFVTLVDREDSEKLARLGDYLDELERRLPIPDVHKNFSRGSSSPIVVVNEVFTAGDTKAGVQTIAFNLPNDERVREAKGSKKVLLKNVSQAKYENISRPIMARVLAEKDLARTSFEAFFYHVLLHEMVHGIGPGNITVDGRETTVARELKDTYSVLEEAKADVVGLYHFKYMVDQGVFDAALAEQVYPSFVGGVFRSVRFGIDAAHGGANILTFNYLRAKGAIGYDAESGRFSVVDEKIGPAVRDLARDILMIQAEGDYAGAQAFLATYRIMPDELRTALDGLNDIPVDIRPNYTIEARLP